MKHRFASPEVAAKFTTMHRLTAAVQIARAMDFLGSRRLLHADLSCRNVLLFAYDEDSPKATVAKLTDFALSLYVPEGHDFLIRKQPQATRWCSPETIVEMKLSFLTDVWSFGALLWELFAGGTGPWVKWEKRPDVAQRLRELTEDKSSTIDIAAEFPLQQGCPEEMHKALLSCLVPKEKLRPSFNRMGHRIQTVICKIEGVDPPPSPPPSARSSSGSQHSEQAAEVVEGVASLVATQDSELPTLSTTATSVMPSVEVPPPASPKTPGGTNEASPSSRMSRTPSVQKIKKKKQPLVVGAPKISWSMEDGTGEVEEAKNGDSRFKVMRAVLRSPQANEVLGEDIVDAMKSEVAEVEAREAFLSDLLQKLKTPVFNVDRAVSVSDPEQDQEQRRGMKQEDLGSPRALAEQETDQNQTDEKAQSEHPEPLREVDVNPRGSITQSKESDTVTAPPLKSAGQSPSTTLTVTSSAEAVSATDTLGASRASHASCRTSVSRDGRFPSSSGSTPQTPTTQLIQRASCQSAKDSSSSPGPPPGWKAMHNPQLRVSRSHGSTMDTWSLWLREGQNIVRRPIAREEEAWQAYNDADQHGRACMLRDPCGSEVASCNWISSYHATVPGSQRHEQRGGLASDLQCAAPHYTRHTVASLEPPNRWLSPYVQPGNAAPQGCCVRDLAPMYNPAPLRPQGMQLV